MRSGARDIKRQPTCVCLPLIPTLVVILAVVLYAYVSSNYSDISSDTWSEVPSKSIAINGNKLYKKKTEGHRSKKLICNLQKVKKPPNLPLLLSFPILRQCKEVNVLERIGSEYRCRKVGTLLLKDDFGQIVEIIFEEQRGNIRKVNTEILKQWLNGKGRQPISWRTLIDVLHSAGLKTLATDINGSCESSVMDLESRSQFYPFDHVMQLAQNLRKVYTGYNPVDPTQNLLDGLDDISFSLPFVMPKVKHESSFNNVLKHLVVGSRLLITGRPGVGKTTLMRYAANMWANNSLLTHCQLSIHVPLWSTIDTLETLISENSECAVEKELVANQIRKSDGAGVCFLLDSFDEYRQPFGRHSQKDFIQKLLKITGNRSEVLPSATVIMTSRPEAVNSIRKYFKQEIEISGFQSEHIRDYLKNLRSPLNETISSILKLNPHVELMCFTPLHLTMMVRLASVEVDKLSSLSTETSLYTQFLFLTVEPKLLTWTNDSLADCFKDKLIQSELCQLFRIVSKLTYDALSIGEQFFNSTLLPKEYSRDKVKTLSLFTIEKRSTSGSIKDGYIYVYYFPHKTFQEFIVACHLYLLSHEEQVNEVLKNQGSYKAVLKYLFGLLGKYDARSAETIFKHYSDGYHHYCNRSREIPCDFNVKQHLKDNIKLLEFAYEARMDEKLLQLVNEMQVIVGPNSIDELYLSLKGPKDCLLLNYALQTIPVRHLVLELDDDELDCTASGIGDNYRRSEFLIKSLKLTISDSESFMSRYISEAVMKALLAIVPTTHMSRYISEAAMKALLAIVRTTHISEVTLPPSLGNNLRVLIKNLLPEKFQSLTIKHTGLIVYHIVNNHLRVTHDVDIVRFSSNLKLLTSLINLNMDLELNSTGVWFVCDAIQLMHNLQTLELSIGPEVNATASNKLNKTIGALSHLKKLTLIQKKGYDHVRRFMLVEETWTLPSWTGDSRFWDFVLLEMLSNLQELQHLKLELSSDFPNYCNCTMLIAGLFSMKQLKELELDIGICYEVEEFIDYNLDHLAVSELSYLSVSRDLMDSPANELIIKGIQSLPHLKHLKIALTKQSLPLISGSLTELEMLDLITFNEVTIEVLDENFSTLLNGLNSLKSFTYDDQSGMPGETSYLSISLKGLSSIHTLLELDLSRNDISSVAAIDLLATSLSNLTKLTTLNLKLTRIGDNGLKVLVGVLGRHLTQLTTLNLKSNHISDDGLMELSEALPHLKKLEYLNLSDNKIGDQGALALAKSLTYLTRVEYIDLSSNRIRDKGIFAIADSVQNINGPVYLKLPYNGAAEETLRKFRLKLKHCYSNIRHSIICPCI